MNAKDFVSAADGIEIPEALDLTADELNVIKAASDFPFDLISLGFKCGFMRGQSVATDNMDKLQEIRKELQKAQSVALCAAIAAGSGEEYACSPANLYPALDSLQSQLLTVVSMLEKGTVIQA